MRKLFAFFLSAVILSSAVSAQTITGIVKDQEGKGVDKTTVSLLKIKDSSVVKLSVTDNQGKFTIQADTAGQYFISTSHIAYVPAYSKLIEVSGAGELSPVELSMIKKEGSLQGVTVTSQKPMVEVRADKMIVNVEGTINAVGNDALELLRKSPGVMVDKDDNLSLSGKNGVQVYIDGKPSPLSGPDLANFLKSIQSSQIEAIELITNPSAKYEAAGNAGIINIKLKKNKAFGTNGSVNAGYNIGTYAKYNGGFSLNHRNSKINVFGNYNYSQGINLNRFVLYREQGDTIFDQSNRMKMRNKGGHNFKTGIDFFVNPKTTIGAIINGNISKNAMHSEGPMDFIYIPTKEITRVLLASSDINMQRENINFNLNYRYAETGGKELNIDADYGIFDLRNNQFQPNHYVTPSGAPLYSNVYRMIAPTDISIYAVKADYEQNFAKGKLGFGGKIGYVGTDNDFQRFDVNGSNEVLDQERSNRFEYKENINAGYVNYNRAYTGFMVQFGLRVENTHSKGISTGLKLNGGGSFSKYDSTINRDYTDVFASAAITFNKNPMSQFGLTYSRRIDRPAYQDLNPFEFKLNDYTFMKGNTQLRPQYTNSFGISHTYKYKLNTVLNYSHVKDIFTQLPDTTDESKSFLTKKNLATQDIVSLNISYPFQYKWYSFFANVNSYYSKFKADFGGGDRKIDQDVFALSFFMQNSFKLGKGWTGEVSGFYNSPSIWQGTFKMNSMYAIDGGLQKTILKGKGTVKATVSDIFKTLKFKGETEFTGQRNVASGNWESRQFKISFNYRFGSMQVKAARQRKTGLEDESKRASGGGGASPVGQ